MKYFFLLSVSCLLIASFSLAQGSDSLFKKMDRLSGNWTATGGGLPGQGSGSFSFQYDLDKNIMIRKNRSEYPAANNKPAFVHDDMMIIYNENMSDGLKAIYFDNEGHTIKYTVSFPSNTIEFVSDAQPNVPTFRLTYSFPAKDETAINFEIASPQSPGNFKSYVKGTAQKVK